MSHDIFKYYIRGYGFEFYCKITKYTVRNCYTIMFGGKDVFCFSASLKEGNTPVPYIDRIEYREQCIKSGIIDELGGTVKLVKCALWTLKFLLPKLSHFTLIDDSHIYCEKGSKQYKMSLAYDSIFKRNMTLYEYRFNATLPSHLMKEYKKSLDVLDEALIPYLYIVELFPIFHKYRAEYESSITPREFVERVRNKYKNAYCYELAKWLTGYAEYLKINYFKEHWIIAANDIEEPPGYELYTTTAAMKGGMIKRRKCIDNSRCIGYYSSQWD